MIAKVILVAAAGLSLLPGEAQANTESPKKKIIQYGWDFRRPEFVRQNIREMEKRPFDGVILRLRESKIFTHTPWNEDDFAATFEDCKNIEWGKFTDNFIIVHAASSMDWFNDEHWEAVRNNLKIILKAANAARCRGICFDPEPYGASPWSYWTQSLAKEKSFQEYQIKARERGADFMRIIQKEMPESVVHMLYQFALFKTIADENNPENVNRLLSKHPYGLYHSFLNGMWDAVEPGIKITEGNEFSYYYTAPVDFLSAYFDIRERFSKLVAPENRVKYRLQAQVSQALYPDYIFGLGAFGERLFSPAPELSQEDRSAWFEHNTFNGLKTADEFVWLYSENMNWWDGTALPEGIESAINRGRARYLKGLGVDPAIPKKVKDAEVRRRKAMQSKVEKTSVDILKAATLATPLQIDGDLTKAFWQSVKPMSAFQSPVSKGNALKAATEVKMTYDEQNLYLAFRCFEPDVKAMRSVESPIWLGDSVDLYLSQGKSSSPFIHLIVNPKNTRWSKVGSAAPDEGGGKNYPGWKSATKVGETEWTVEMSVPWAEFGMKAPAPGETRSGNLCRFRVPDGEISSWAKVLKEFTEQERFGVWTFR